VKTEIAISFFKTPARMARKLGISRQAVNSWGKYPPLGRQFQIELLTNGELKATTTNPDEANLPTQA